MSTRGEEEEGEEEECEEGSDEIEYDSSGDEMPPKKQRMST